MQRRHRDFGHRALGGEPGIDLGVQDQKTRAQRRKRQHQTAGGVKPALGETPARNMRQRAQQQHKRQHRDDQRSDNPVPLQRGIEGHNGPACEDITL